jgi:hypothetical protein
LETTALGARSTAFTAQHAEDAEENRGEKLDTNRAAILPSAFFCVLFG